MANYLNIEDYPFAHNDFMHYFKSLYKDRGLKAIYQFLNRPHYRAFSKGLITKFAPTGVGLEIGVGARTICPATRTILSDGYSEHGLDNSVARVFFKGDKIPYENKSFDFVLSEHVLEHISNPIKAIKEWLRVTKSGGHIFLFLPHKERTNDCHRLTTTLEHLIEDEKNDVSFDDSTHFNDWIENVVNKGLMPDHYKHIDKEELLKTASIHHHVWTEKEIIELLEYLNLKVVYSNNKVPDRRDSFVVIAQKI